MCFSGGCHVLGSNYHGEKAPVAVFLFEDVTLDLRFKGLLVLSRTEHTITVERRGVVMKSYLLLTQQMQFKISQADHKEEKRKTQKSAIN